MSMNEIVYRSRQNERDNMLHSNSRDARRNEQKEQKNAVAQSGRSNAVKVIKTK